MSKIFQRYHNCSYNEERIEILQNLQALWPKSARTCGPGSLRTRAPFAESCNNRAVFFDLVSCSYDPLTSSFKFNLTKNHKIKDNKVGLSQHNREALHYLYLHLSL